MTELPKPHSNKKTKTITISYNPRIIERIIYLTIILILLALLIYPKVTDRYWGNDSIDPVEENSDVIENNSILSTNNSVKNTTVNESEEEIVNETSTEPETETTTEEDIEEDLYDFSGPIVKSKISMSIDKVETEKKTETWGKLTELTFTIYNRGRSFRPRIEVFAYDDDTESLLDTYVQDTITYSLGVLKDRDEIITKDISVSFSALDLEKTLVLELYDDDTDTHILTKTKTGIMIE